MSDKSLVTGGIGVPPPPDAPYETTQPLQPETIAKQRDLAREHERELQPLAFERKKGPIEEAIDAAHVGKKDPFYERLEAEQARQPKTATVDPDRLQPAASDGDTPTKGLPGTTPKSRFRTTEPLRPSGGFGDTAEAQYYPINGDELRVIVAKLLDELEQRIQNDLRFHLAMVYPRVSVKLQLVVEAETSSQGFEIERIAAHDKTPLEVAKEYGDSVVFVMTEQRREFDETDEVETPPDAMREEVGLDRPRKQMVQQGMGRQIVDRLGF